MPKFTDRSRLLHHMAAGLVFTVTFLLGLGGGYLVDLYMGTTPGFTANGAVIGFLVAVWRLFRQGREILKEGEAERQEAAEKKAAERGAAANKTVTGSVMSAWQVSWEERETPDEAGGPQRQTAQQEPAKDTGGERQPAEQKPRNKDKP